MVNYYLHLHNQTRDGRALCGIEFASSNDTSTHHKIDFKLRFAGVPQWYSKSLIRENWFTRQIMPDVSSAGPRERRANDGGKPGYSREFFLLVQHLVTMVSAKVIYQVSYLFHSCRNI